MIQKIDNATVREAVQQAYERCKNETGGKNADYIPYLANVPSTLFGIAACLPDGEVIAVGDTDYKFGIESVSKVPTAILAMNQYSAQEVLTKIGADATGLPFNSIMAILLENDHPSTPLVNAGAISACSMVQPVGDSDGKWKAITGFIEGLAGSQVEVIDELYKSETATNFNNKSIAWLLKNYNRIYDDPDMALDIYTRQCSIGVTAKQLATMAATIANGGKNPVTKQQVFKPELSPKIASMMATVGFYEHTGDWLFTTGLPAKTGVGGGIMGIGKAVNTGFANNGILTIMSYWGEGTTFGQFMAYIIGIVVSFVGAAVLTYLVGFEDTAVKTAPAQSAPAQPSLPEDGVASEIKAPVEGKAYPLNEVPDDVFASGALGGGIGILPSKGLVVAPADATVSVIHSTLHALGLQMADGTELLIHVGVDTVEMNGDGFHSFVKEGDRVKKGDKLLSFDIDKIKAAGHNTTVSVIVSNSDDFKAVEGLPGDPVDLNCSVIRTVH